MGWQEFMGLECRQLEERREGKLRRALGDPLADETKEQLERIGEGDRIRACQGLVAVVREDDREDRLAAEWLEVGWQKQRAERRRKGVGAPPVPKHLG